MFGEGGGRKAGSRPILTFPSDFRMLLAMSKMRLWKKHAYSGRPQRACACPARKASYPFFSILLAFAVSAPAAVTNIFFNASQTMTITASNMTAVTINSDGYLFTYSQDGYFTGGVGLTNPVGRFFSVLWPNGVQAQAITVQPQPPTPAVPSGANITIKRVDGKLFDLQSFTGKLLLNTAGAGGAFEIMPQLNGNDAFADPLQYDCTGYGGQSFAYTPTLTDYDTYLIHMWGDFALTALTLTDINPVIPVSAITNTITASVSPVGAGTIGGAGDYTSNSICTVTASPNAGWGFRNWTQNGTQVSVLAAYTFTVRSTCTLVANFIPVCTVTTTTSPNYGGAVNGGGTFNSNATVTVSAAPASGFEFVNWTEYGATVSTANNYTFNISANHALIANFAMLPQTALFDFDTGWPTVGPMQGMPSTQSNRNMTAIFSTLSGGWSIQNTIYGWVSPLFFGNFLYPSTWGSTLAIQFDKPITNFSMKFVTADLTVAGDVRTAVRAYTNSMASPAVGSTTSQGSLWVNGPYPDGTLSLGSTTPFNIIKLDFPSGQPTGVSELLFVDNIIVQRAAVQSCTISASSWPTNAGSISGAGSHEVGTTANLTATANFGFDFSNWTENGTVVETLPSYSFTVITNRTLVANFVTNPPPLALGGTFYQITNTPLAINIGDLMAFDYDPDGDPVYFTGVSATTSNGLTLTTGPTQIMVPSNSVADSFTYTINDGNGYNATGTGNIAITNSAAGRAMSLDVRTEPASVAVKFSGVPWYYYDIQRATNVYFSGSVQVWPVQAWADGSIYLTDDFLDLGGKPTQAFYRSWFVP